MNWELVIGVGVPVATGVIVLVNKLGNIDTKLGKIDIRLEFLEKTVGGLIGRMDRYDDRYQKRLRKKYR